MTEINNGTKVSYIPEKDEYLFAHTYQHGSKDQFGMNQFMISKWYDDKDLGNAVFSNYIFKCKKSKGHI